jgi:hypothetical protein
MGEKRSHKASYYEWLSEMESVMREIRTHVDRLPEEGSWDDEDFHEVAQMWAKIGRVGNSAFFLYNGMGEILQEKMRLDAGRN